MFIINMNTLSKWNYIAACAHLAAALGCLVLLKNPLKRTVQLTELAYKENQNSQSRIDIPVELADTTRVDLKFVVVAFFAVTSAAHFLYATDFFGTKLYSSQINGFGWNPYRWIEYSISAGLMVYLISIASGTKDSINSISQALIVPSLMINGFTNERALQQNELHAWSVNNSKFKKPKIDEFIVYSNLLPAWALFAVNWYVILANYSRLASQAKEAGEPLDSSVTFMVYSQLVFFSLFGVIQTYQVLRWQFSKPGRTEPSYIAYEKAYIVLSAVTKLFLAGTVAYSLRD